MPLVIRLDAELESGLRALSEQAHTPQAELVRQLIRERLTREKKRKSAFEIAQEMGVIGMDFTVHMDPETVRQLESLAKKMGKTRNAVVNIAVNEFVRSRSESVWPESVARWLAVGKPASIRNFEGFEANRAERGALREIDL